MAADLALAFGNQGWGKFHDLDELTIFADNLVPHVLRVDGVLAYDGHLARQIEGQELIPLVQMRRLRFELARCTRSNSWSKKSRLQVRPPRQRHSTFCSITAASRRATRLRTRGIERERSFTDSVQARTS